MTMKITFQVCRGVGRILISGSRIVEAGNQMTLDKVSPKIVTAKGEEIALQRKAGVFVISLKVRKGPGPKDDKDGGKMASMVFPRQGQ